ncbi:MAG: 3-isopropylmalate dehydratase small subunit [Rhodospirillales bacterium]
MDAFRKLTAVAAPYDLDNVDTDQIIPARFLKYPRSGGYGQFLFHDQRRNEDGSQRADFVLNRPDYKAARILVTGENFGCGSSREGAVYALADSNFRAVIAPSFGQIFHNNCFKNGILPVVLPHDRIKAIAARLKQNPGSFLTVDLERNVVIVDGPNGDQEIPFTVDAFWREALLAGVDEIGLTLTYSEKIAAFERDYHKQFDWLQ